MPCELYKRAASPFWILAVAGQSTLGGNGRCMTGFAKLFVTLLWKCLLGVVGDQVCSVGEPSLHTSGRLGPQE